jgi:hypothetical protein
MTSRNKALRYRWLRAYFVLGLECNWSVLSAMDGTRPILFHPNTIGFRYTSYDEEHRVNGPSWYAYDGSAEYRQNDLLHRWDGPALTHTSVGCWAPYMIEYYHEGKLVSHWDMYEDEIPTSEETE